MPSKSGFTGRCFAFAITAGIVAVSANFASETGLAQTAPAGGTTSIQQGSEKAREMIRPQIHDDEAPANYFRALRDVAAWMPKNSILSAEGAGTMDIGLTQLPSFNARSCLNAGTYGTMGVGLGQAIAAAVAEPNRAVVHLSGDSAIRFSGLEMETLVRYCLPVKIVVLNNGALARACPKFRTTRCN
jgi:2-hydroxyacyl-CoA lyase 1